MRRVRVIGTVTSRCRLSRRISSFAAVPGFESPSIEPTRVYTRDDAVALLAGTGLEEGFADEMEVRIMSGFVRATKPGASAPRSATPARRLAVAETTPETSTSTRACGCDDGCCT